MNVLNLTQNIGVALNKMISSGDLIAPSGDVNISPIVEAIIAQKQEESEKFKLFLAGMILDGDKSPLADQVALIEEHPDVELIDFLDDVYVVRTAEDMYDTDTFIDFINQKFNP